MRARRRQDATRTRRGLGVGPVATRVRERYVEVLQHFLWPCRGRLQRGSERTIWAKVALTRRRVSNLLQSESFALDPSTPADTSSRSAAHFPDAAFASNPRAPESADVARGTSCMTGKASRA